MAKTGMHFYVTLLLLLRIFFFAKAYPDTGQYLCKINEHPILKPISASPEVEDQEYFSHAYRRYVHPSPTVTLPELLALPKTSCGEKPCDESITVVMGVHRRPEIFAEVLDSIRAQVDVDIREIRVSVFGSPFDENFRLQCEEQTAKDPRVNCALSKNSRLGYYARFQLALQAFTKYVFVLDDDNMPGNRFFSIAVHAMRTEAFRGMVGIRGCRVLPPKEKSLFSGQDELISADPLHVSAEMDIPFSMYILESAWVPLLFREKPYTYKTAEDSQLAYSLRKYAAVKFHILPIDTSDESTNGFAKTVGGHNRSWTDDPSSTLPSSSPDGPIELDVADRRHRPLREESHFVQWGRGDRYYYTQHEGRRQWLLFCGDTANHATQLSPLFLELLHLNVPSQPMNYNPYSIFPVQDLAVRESPAVTDRVRLVLTGRVPDAFVNISTRGVKHPIYLQNLGIGTDFWRAERFSDVVADVLQAFTPTLESTKPCATVIVHDGSPASFAFALASSMRSIDVYAVPTEQPAKPSLFTTLTEPMIKGVLTSLDDVRELKCNVRWE